MTESSESKDGFDEEIEDEETITSENDPEAVEIEQQDPTLESEDDLSISAEDDTDFDESKESEIFVQKPKSEWI